MTNKTQTRLTVFNVIYGTAIFMDLLCSFLSVVAIWYFKRFNVSLEGLLFTLKSPKTGANSEVVTSAVEWCLPRIIVCWIIVALIVKLGEMLRKDFNKETIYVSYRFGVIIITAVYVYMFAYGLNLKLDIDGYLIRKNQTTTLYEDYYVHPNSVLIDNICETNNLIYIYLESMESNCIYEMKEGEFVNLTPNLSELAEKNINFSDSDGIGGFYSPTGTDWTMGGLLASSSGIPFRFPVEGNDMSNRKNFAPKLISLGDILEENGYINMFMCGSDIEYGGRSVYYDTHGYKKIFDFFDAYPDGWESYNIGWWGIEDEKLFEYAKEELLKLYKSSEKFSFTLLTVDTHFGDGVIDGYVCRLCENEYDDRYANVISCIDKQVFDFVEWIQQQDFYDDTTIIITGDHPFMGTKITEASESSTVYNCIINAKTEPKNTQNRIFTTFDIFPTTLAAIGFDIEGDKLGLGVNMFSDKQTIAEEIGLGKLNVELLKYSQFYVDEFE